MLSSRKTHVKAGGAKDGTARLGCPNWPGSGPKPKDATPLARVRGGGVS